MYKIVPMVGGELDSCLNLDLESFTAANPHKNPRSDKSLQQVKGVMKHIGQVKMILSGLKNWLIMYYSSFLSV